MWRWGVSASALGVALAGSVVAQAQSTTPDAPPPVVQNVDANGVDLTSGLLTFSAKQVSIGPSTGGLARVKQNFQAEDNYYGAVNSSGSTYTVSLAAGSETFTLSGSVYTANQQSGSTLTYNANSGLYTYTKSDGSVAVYSNTYNNSNTNPMLSVGMAEIVSYTSPTGEALTYTYYDYHTVSGPKTEPIDHDRYYLASVTNNRGLQIKYNLQLPGTNAAYQLLGVQAVNNAVDYCAPGGSGGCANTSQTWPSVSFSGTSATDPLNRTTNYGAPAASSTQTLSRPAGDYMSYTYDSSGRVTSVTNGVGTWTYGYTISGTTLTVTIKDPNGDTRTVTANTATSELVTDKDALGRTTSYAYDTAMRLTSVTHPHGDVITYTYDENETGPRGDVTTTTWTPAGGGTAIVTHASYDSSCTYAAKCNKPNTTTDARGAVTSYTYDNTTGVLLSVTRPAVTMGSGGAQVQPQTRYSYAWQQANLKTASGTTQGGGHLSADRRLDLQQHRLLHRDRRRDPHPHHLRRQPQPGGLLGERLRWRQLGQLRPELHLRRLRQPGDLHQPAGRGDQLCLRRRPGAYGRGRAGPGRGGVADARGRQDRLRRRRAGGGERDGLGKQPDRHWLL